MSIEKEDFLRTRLVSYLQKLDPSTPPHWGKMNAQQMVEHFASDVLQNANGRLKFEKIITLPEKLDKLRDFLMSEKPFNENTINPLLSKEPPFLKYNTIQAAIGALQEELICFFETFDNNPALIIRNPIFGDLDFEQSVQLLYKHALHHLKQFGIVPLER